jgi:hypothetical protein
MTVQEILKETLELERKRRHRRHDVEIFDRLLATLHEVPPSLWHAYAAARERDTNAGISGGGTFVESDYLRSIGFREKPESAAAYIHGYIAAVGLDRMTGSTKPAFRLW